MQCYSHHSIYLIVGACNECDLSSLIHIFQRLVYLLTTHFETVTKEVINTLVLVYIESRMRRKFRRIFEKEGKQCIQQRTKREKLYQLHTRRGCAAIDAPWSYRNKYDLWNHRHSEEIEQVYRCQCQFQINCKILWLIKYVIHHMAGHQEWDCTTMFKTSSSISLHFFVIKLMLTKVWKKHPWTWNGKNR